jgi:hypothetical protein
METTYFTPEWGDLKYGSIYHALNALSRKNNFILILMFIMKKRPIPMGIHK